MAPDNVLNDLQGNPNVAVAAQQPADPEAAMASAPTSWVRKLLGLAGDRVDHGASKHEDRQSGPGATETHAVAGEQCPGTWELV